MGPATAEAAGSSTVVPAIPFKHLEGIGKTVMVHDAPNQKKWPENGKGFRAYCWSNPGPRIKQLILGTLASLHLANYELSVAGALPRRCDLRELAIRVRKQPGESEGLAQIREAGKEPVTLVPGL